MSDGDAAVCVCPMLHGDVAGWVCPMLDGDAAGWVAPTLGSAVFSMSSKRSYKKKTEVVVSVYREGVEGLHAVTSRGGMC